MNSELWKPLEESITVEGNGVTVVLHSNGVNITRFGRAIATINLYPPYAVCERHPSPAVVTQPLPDDVAAGMEDALTARKEEMFANANSYDQALGRIVRYDKALAWLKQQRDGGGIEDE